jgi:hypothetical protein
MGILALKFHYTLNTIEGEATKHTETCSRIKVNKTPKKICGSIAKKCHIGI